MHARVRDWMNPDVETAYEDDAALLAFDRMMERGVRHLPVVNDTLGVIGILSLDDLRAAFPIDVSLRQDLGPMERSLLREDAVTVADAMTWAPRTVHPEAKLEDAALELAQQRIGCLPVVDADDKLIGILSEVDALRGLVAQSRGEASAVRSPEKKAVASEGLVGELREEAGRLASQLQRWQDTERVLSADIHDEGDFGDRANDESEIAQLDLISQRASQRLRAIEAAIDRAARGQFGICERCHTAIPVDRLRAIPEATTCVACARAESGPGAQHLPAS